MSGVSTCEAGVTIYVNCGSSGSGNIVIDTTPIVGGHVGSFLIHGTGDVVNETNYGDGEQALKFTAAATGPGTNDPVEIEVTGAGNLKILGMDGPAATQGGGVEISSGNGGAGGGPGGDFSFVAGEGDGAAGGNFFIDAGPSDGGAGGAVAITAGSALSGNNNGGSITLTLGLKSGSGADGFLILNNLTTANPGGSNRVWNDSGFLAIT